MKEKEKHAAREARLIGTDRAPAGPSEIIRAPVGQRLEKKYNFKTWGNFK